MEAADEGDFKKYGFSGGAELRPGVIDVNKIVEKPGSREASPSNLALCNGFVMTPDIFKYLHQALDRLQEGRELYCTDALELMLADNKRIVAMAPEKGVWYDTGDKLSYMKTVVDFALQRKDIGERFREYLRQKVQ
jgi:UTP--glucose-1-phosphate uridylyltransferase